MRTFSFGFGVLRIKTAHCMSVIGAWLVGTRGSVTRTSVDGPCDTVCVDRSGGGSANSVVHVSRKVP